MKLEELFIPERIGVKKVVDIDHFNSLEGTICKPTLPSHTYEENGNINLIFLDIGNLNQELSEILNGKEPVNTLLTHPSKELLFFKPEKNGERQFVAYKYFELAELLSAEDLGQSNNKSFTEIDSKKSN